MPFYKAKTDPNQFLKLFIRYPVVHADGIPVLLIHMIRFEKAFSINTLLYRFRDILQIDDLDLPRLCNSDFIFAYTAGHGKP